MSKLSRLAQLRHRAGLSQRALGQAAGVAYPTIARLEAGHSNAKPLTARKLAEVLHVEPRQLMDDAPGSAVSCIQSDDVKALPVSSYQRDLFALPRLQSCRERSGCTPEELEWASSVKVATIVRIESGRSSACLDTALKLARALGFPLLDLMEEQPPVCRLRLARYRAGMTMLALQARSGVTRRAIRLIEDGRHRAKLSTLAKLARALDTDVQDVMNRPPNPSRTMVRLGVATGKREDSG